MMYKMKNQSVSNVRLSEVEAPFVPVDPSSTSLRLTFRLRSDGQLRLHAD